MRNMTKQLKKPTKSESANKSKNEFAKVSISIGIAILILWLAGLSVLVFAMGLPVLQSSDLMAAPVALVNLTIWSMATLALIYLRRGSRLSTGKFVAIVLSAIITVIVASNVTVPIYRAERVDRVAPLMLEYINNKYDEKFILEEALYETSGSPGSNNYVRIFVHPERDPSLRVGVSGSPGGSFSSEYKDSLDRAVAEKIQNYEFEGALETLRSVVPSVNKGIVVGSEGIQNTDYKNIQVSFQIDNEVPFDESEWQGYLRYSSGSKAILSMLNAADIAMYQENLINITDTLRDNGWAKYGLDYRLGRPYSYVSVCTFTADSLENTATVKKRFVECLNLIPHIKDYLQENPNAL